MESVIEIRGIAVMRLSAQLRNLGMKNGIVMAIHDAVYLESPANEAEEARNWTTERQHFVESGIQTP